jgi:hypothetical protein
MGGCRSPRQLADILPHFWETPIGSSGQPNSWILTNNEPGRREEPEEMQAPCGRLQAMVKERKVIRWMLHTVRKAWLETTGWLHRFDDNLENRYPENLKKWENMKIQRTEDLTILNRAIAALETELGDLCGGIRCLRDRGHWILRERPLSR